MSRLEDTFAVQLTALFQQHGWDTDAIVQEHQFAPPRKWRADFAIGQGYGSSVDRATGDRYTWFYPYAIEPEEEPRFVLLIEIEGGTRQGGRHNRHEGYTNDAYKYSAASALGYTIIRGTSQMVNDGTLLLMVEQVLTGEVDVTEWKAS